MSRLERMNDWCGKVLNKAIRYDDLITFSFFAIMLTVLIVVLVTSTLGIFGTIQCGFTK